MVLADCGYSLVRLHMQILEDVLADGIVKVECLGIELFLGRPGVNGGHEYRMEQSGDEPGIADNRNQV